MPLKESIFSLQSENIFAKALQIMDLSIKFTGTKEFHTKFVSAQTFANHKFGKWIKNICSLKIYNVLMRTLYIFVMY